MKTGYTIGKDHFINQVRRLHPEFSTLTIQRSLNAILDTLTQELKKGTSVKLYRFGSFRVQKVTRGRAIGASPKLPLTVRFRPSEVLRDNIK